MVALVAALALVGSAPVVWGAGSSPVTIVPASVAASPFGDLGSEIVARRTRTSRTYFGKSAYEGKRIARVYAGSVNYQSTSGDWEPIDNALVATSGGYRNKAGWFDVALPSRLGSGNVTVREDGDRVGFALRDAGGSGVVSGSKITYADALPGVDLSYEVKADWLKELITLASASARRSFVFDLTLDVGLRPVLVKSGAVEIRNRSGTVRMAIAAPFMTDADGEESYAVRFALAEAGDRWRLTLTADDGWLDAPGRAWPVVIDPQVFPGSQADCTIDQANPSTNFCGASTLAVGGSSGSEKRSVLRFDIAGAVPFGSTVTSAALGMKLQSQTVSEAMTISLHRLNQAWGTVAYWGYPWWTPGGYFPSAADCQSCPLVGGAAAGGGTQPGSYAYWWIPALVEGWANGTITNNGMLLKASTLTANGNVVSFASNEAPYGSQPFIDTTYTPPPRTGEHPQSTFETQSLTDRSSVGVNVSNGNLLVSNMDLQIAGTGLDLLVDRYYNGLSGATGSLGKAWKMGTAQDVQLFDGGGWATVRGPTGELLTFTRNPDGTYASPPGVHATLALVPGPPPPSPCEDQSCTPGPPTFKLTGHASGGELEFKSPGTGRLGPLIAQRDRYGNTISFNYDGVNNLMSIVDTQGRGVGVTQNAGRIERLTDYTTGRTIQYGYDTQGRLATYTDAETKQTRYGYDSASRLNSITTPGGRVTKITYDSQGRVTTVVRTTDTAHTTGPTTTFAYGTGAPCVTGQTKTVVSDPDAATSAGHTVTYCADSSDRVAKTIDSSAHTTSLTYGATGDVASVTLPGGGVTNYAYDTATRNLLCVQRGVTVVQNCQTTTGGLKTILTYASTDALTQHFPTAITNPQGNTLAYCYNGSVPACGSGNTGPPGSLQSVSNGLATQNVQRFAYYLNGNMASSTDARGNTTTYAYDGPGNLTSVTPPNQAYVPPGSTRVGATTITRDALSRPATITDAKNQTTTYSYDNLDRPKQIVYRTSPGGTIDRTITHTFDNDGPLRTLTDPTGVTTYTIDDLLRLTREAFVSGGTVLSYTHDYTYDAASNLKTLTDAGGTTTYTYDGLNQLSAMREPVDTQEPPQDTLFSYNSDGARTQIKYTSGVTVNTGYDIPSGRITSVTNKGPAGNILKSFTYTYLLGTRDTELPQKVTTELGHQTTNTYDQLDRLVDQNTTGTNAPSPLHFAFVLDGNGNRTSETIDGLTRTWSYDEVNSPCWRAYWNIGTSPTGGPYTCASRPSTDLASTETLTHDANGNDIDNKHQAFTYNAANQPASSVVNLASGTTGSQALAYRGAGRSQLIKDGAATVQNNLLGIGARGSGTTYYPRADDGTVISERLSSPDARRNYLYDGNGSVIGLTDRSGALRTTYRYDGYCHPLNRASKGDENPFGCAGTYMAGVGTNGVLCGPFNIGAGGVPYDAEDGRYTMMAFSLDDPSGYLLDPGIGGGLGLGINGVQGSVASSLVRGTRRAQGFRDMRRSGNPARRALGWRNSPGANRAVRTLGRAARRLAVVGPAVDYGVNLSEGRSPAVSGARTAVSTVTAATFGIGAAGACGAITGGVAAAGCGFVGGVVGGALGNALADGLGL